MCLSGGDGTRTHEPLDCQSSALPAELRPRSCSEGYFPPSQSFQVATEVATLNRFLHRNGHRSRGLRGCLGAHAPLETRIPDHLEGTIEEQRSYLRKLLAAVVIDKALHRGGRGLDLDCITMAQ